MLTMDLFERVEALEQSVLALGTAQEFGDSPGHPFRGNQHTGGLGEKIKGAIKSLSHRREGDLLETLDPVRTRTMDEEKDSLSPAGSKKFQDGQEADEPYGKVAYSEKEKFHDYFISATPKQAEAHSNAPKTAYEAMGHPTWIGQMPFAGNEGNPEALRHWYDEGAKDQIDWGQPGDFMRCVEIASKYMDDDQAKGFCNLRHQDATGAPPGHAPGEEKASRTASLFERLDALTEAVIALGISEFDMGDEMRDFHGRWTRAAGDQDIVLQRHEDLGGARHDVVLNGRTRLGSIQQKHGFRRGLPNGFMATPITGAPKEVSSVDEAAEHIINSTKAFQKTPVAASGE